MWREMETAGKALAFIYIYIYKRDAVLLVYITTKTIGLTIEKKHIYFYKFIIWVSDKLMLYAFYYLDNKFEQ